MDKNVDDMNFSNDVQVNYSLQKKHLFKKKARNACKYYQLTFGENLENDLAVLHKLYISNTPFKIFGLHTNLYITKNGYDGLFVDISPKNSSIIFNEINETFTVTSNVTVSEFVNFTMKKGYDFAALTGIPGFVGSGVLGNSSWTPSGKDFGSFVKEVTVYDFEEGKTVKFIPDDTFFQERDSYIKQGNKIKTKYFVKEIVLKSDFVGEALVREKFNEQIEKRKNSLRIAFEEGCAGSLWSNVSLRKLTGKSFPNMLRENPDINKDFNGATYSPNGSLFFITQEGTNDSDVAKLFVHTINKVKELYNIDLHKEVIILDSDGEISLETFIDRYLPH